MTLPATPRYSHSLTTVLPSVARGLGVSVGDHATLDLGGFRRAVVVLVDGMGLDLLERRRGHAPFLRSLLDTAHRLDAGFPSTTATSMGSFGTGLPPGAHGLLGYEVLIPGEDRLLNQLSWEEGPVPEEWQPEETIFERAERDGVRITRIGPWYFDGSGLTRAALRGGEFVAAKGLDERVDATLAAVRAQPRSLVHLYWGDLDKIGHVHGCESWQWGEELAGIDAELTRLCASVPEDTAVFITADHGMVDVPHEDRIDVALEPDLAAGVRHVTGEARAVQLYCEPGASADVHQTWVERLGDRAWVRTRTEAVAAGWFGPTARRNLARIGDLVVAMRDDIAVVDSRRARPQLLALIGLHGSLTEAEVAIPLLHIAPGAGRGAD